MIIANNLKLVDGYSHLNSWTCLDDITARDTRPELTQTASR